MNWYASYEGEIGISILTRLKRSRLKEEDWVCFQAHSFCAHWALLIVQSPSAVDIRGNNVIHNNNNHKNNK